MQNSSLSGHQNKPAWVGRRDVFKEPVVLVAAGWTHAACMTSKGVFYTCGNGKHGELGDGFRNMPHSTPKNHLIFLKIRLIPPSAHGVGRTLHA